MMNELEKKLLQVTMGGAEPRLSIRTKTRVDVGRWWRRNPLWLCVVDDKLVLLAVARRRYIQSVLLLECMASDYCNATGELVVKPVEGLEFGHIAMSPADALRVLEEIRSGIHGGRAKVTFDGTVGA